MLSENHGGSYHLLRLPVLLEYRCPGGKVMKRSQSSLSAFISEENQTDPSRPHPMYKGQMPIASRAAIKLLSHVSRRTNENMPSNISTNSSPYSS
uniref:Asn1 n=1 Tax=Arundo donax TaxID=35708 RepID=A0A0A9FZ00_ARUDO